MPGSGSSWIPHTPLAALVTAKSPAGRGLLLEVAATDRCPRSPSHTLHKHDKLMSSPGQQLTSDPKSKFAEGCLAL